MDQVEARTIAQQVYDLQPLPVVAASPLVVTITAQHLATGMIKWAETVNLSGAALTVKGVTFCAANVGTLVCDLKVNGVSVLTGTVAVAAALTGYQGAIAAAALIPAGATIELWASSAASIYALNMQVWCER